MINITVRKNTKATKYEVDMMARYEDKILGLLNKARVLDIPIKELKWVMSSDFAEVICLCSEINTPVSHWIIEDDLKSTILKTYHGIEVEEMANYDSDFVLELALKEVQDEE